VLELFVVMDMAATHGPTDALSAQPIRYAAGKGCSL
jgi:hypothetical protein